MTVKAILRALASAAAVSREPPPTPAIHVSGKNDHDECPRKWALGDRDWGLHWVPRFPPSALFIGDIVHQAAFLYYHRGYDLTEGFTEVAQAEVDAIKERVPGTVLWDEEKEQMTNDLILTEGMLRGYLAWQDEDEGKWADSQLEYIKMERAFHITFEGVPIAGRIDGLARRRDTGELILLEHKTCRSIDELKASLTWDLQPKLYAAAAEIMYKEPVTHILYNMLQKTDPFAIPLLQNGLPSKAKSNVSTATAYYTVLAEAMDNLNMGEAERDRVTRDYGDHIQYLLLNPPKLYERWAYQISDEEKEFALRQMTLAYPKMREDWVAMHNGTWPTEVMPYLNRFRCPMRCSFKDVCAAMNSGGDWEQMLHNNFVRGDHGAESG